MKRKIELDYMNAVGSLLVILIHVLSIGIVSLDPTSWKAAIIFFPHRLSAFVVPMFLYNGAIKMALQFRDKEISLRLYTRYCFNRLRKIYVPYIIWNIIYYIMFLRIGWVSGEKGELLRYIINGTLSAPFYYIIITMQFYFLMPIWMKFVRNISAPLGITFALLIMLCIPQFNQLLSLNLNFKYTDRIFLTYILYWVIGLYVGFYYEEAVPLIRQKFDTVICICAVAFSCVLSYIQYSSGVIVFDMNNVKVMSDICSIMLLHYFSIQMLKFPYHLKLLLQKLYNSSYFVFLSHCAVLTLTEYFYFKFGIQRMSLILIIRFLTCYTLPFLLFYIWEKVTGKIGSFYKAGLHR